MEKSGVSAPMTKTERKLLPEGFSIRYVAERKQPYTIWMGDETVGFTTQLHSAIAFARNYGRD